MIPIARPDVGPEEAAAVAEVLASGMIVQGRRVAELEERWAEYFGVKHAIAVSNGTVALMCIFAGLGLGPGDEVITVGHTFNATVSSILYTGATPVFVDIEPDTYLIDASRIEAAITPRTRAICPVHLFGLVADMDMITAIADRHGLAVVEDACQAHGATFRGRRAGSFGPRRVQPLRDEEHDDRRGRLHHDRRRSAGRLDPPLPQPGHARALPPRDPRLQLPADRHRGRHRARPVRQARAEHGAPAGHRARATTRRSPTCRHPAAGDTRGPDPRLPPVHDRRRARRATRSSPICRRAASASGSTTRSRSIASRTSWSGASQRTCRSPTGSPPARSRCRCTRA